MVKIEISFDEKDVKIAMSAQPVSQVQKDITVCALISAINAIIRQPLPLVIPANGGATITTANGKGLTN